jgi:hypothetical protein
MECLREEVRWVPVVEWVFVAGEEWMGCGRKQKEKMRDIRGCRGARQAQIMETLASREDQTAASEFASRVESVSGMISWMEGLICGSVSHW